MIKECIALREGDIENNYNASKSCFYDRLVSRLVGCVVQASRKVRESFALGLFSGGAKEDHEEGTVPLSLPQACLLSPAAIAHHAFLSLQAISVQHTRALEDKLQMSALAMHAESAFLCSCCRASLLLQQHRGALLALTPKIRGRHWIHPISAGSNVI